MKLVFLLLLLQCFSFSFGQEICNNAIDDDGDGLIDLNDEDCICDPAFGSLIPNHSFEDTLCCDEFECMESWSFDVGINSGHYHNTTCGGDTPWGIPEADLEPLPDGIGFLSFDGDEFPRVCLDAPLLAGVTYYLSLYTASTEAPDTIDLAIYGTPNCDDLTLDATCISDVGEWTLMSSQIVYHEELATWQETVLEFTPAVDIYGVAIGSVCELTGHFFMDELVLLDFYVGVSLAAEGGWCSGDKVLSAESDSVGGTWQWYKDGIALVGETTSVLEPVPYGEGEFTIVYSFDEFCVSTTYNSPPAGLVADYALSDEICFPGVTYYENLTEVEEGEDVDYIWWFGDGTESTEESPSYIYPLAGIYDVSLIVVSSDSTCNDTLTSTYTMMQRPTASFDFSGLGMFVWAGNEVGCVNNPINFEDLSWVADPSTIVSWSWDFGDGTTSTEPNPVHVYEDYGIFDITLTVETEFGCTDDYIYEGLYIVTLAPDFTVEDECVFDELIFVNTSDPLIPAELESFLWDFGDGGTAETEDATYTFTESGTYNVELIVVSESGCTDTMTKTVEVYPLPEPHFEFIVDGVSSESGGTGGCYTSPVQFNDLSVVADPGTITTWAWDFGDGETSTEENPTHLYESEGAYTVTLSVTSNFGCEAEISMEILMTNGIAFLASDTTICQNGTAVVWAASSDGSPHSYNWSIPGADDGASQEIEGLTEDYWVYVSSTNEAGCVSPVDSILIMVFDPITLDISPFDTVCIGESSGATVITEGGNGDYSFEWTANGVALPDNTPTIITNPVIITEYCVTVSDGCETTPVTICTQTYVPEMVVFTSDTTQGCEPTEITFTDLTGPIASLNESTWTINGITLYGNSVSYLFEEAGEYTVSLDVLSPEGCVTNNTVANYIIIHPLPEPELYATPNPTTYFNTEVDVVNINPNINSSFEWYLPGGSPEWAISDSLVEVTYPELISGNYSVSLIETTQYGCVDSTSITIVINNDQIIYAPNVFTPDGNGFNETWGIYVEGIDIYDFHLTMFNRWGEVIWESYNPAAHWNGTYGGEIVQDGVYVWVITAKDRENDKVYEYKGVVTVLK